MPQTFEHPNYIEEEFVVKYVFIETMFIEQNWKRSVY